MSESTGLRIATTQRKLRLLEDRLAASRRETGGNAHHRELSERSLTRLINELKEELARLGQPIHIK